MGRLMGQPAWAVRLLSGFLLPLACLLLATSTTGNRWAGGSQFHKKGGEKEMDYISIESKNGESFEIMEWIPRIAKEYGWTTGLLDESLAVAIERAREDTEDPYNCQQSLSASRLTYEAMQFCRGLRSSKEIHTGDSEYLGEPILAIRATGNE